MAQTVQKKQKRKATVEASPEDSSPPPKRPRPSTARKSTGGRPPKPPAARGDRDDDRVAGPSRRKSCFPMRPSPALSVSRDDLNRTVVATATPPQDSLGARSPPPSARRGGTGRARSRSGRSGSTRRARTSSSASCRSRGWCVRLLRPRSRSPQADDTTPRPGAGARDRAGHDDRHAGV